MSAVPLEARGSRVGGVVLGAAAPRVADWLHLAATPTFALMAVLTAALGGGMPDVLCSAAAWSPLGGMVPMYLLMSIFHVGPWLKLISVRASDRG